MQISVITSCTGEKSVSHARALTADDFTSGEDHLHAREAELAEVMRPAEELYSGQQHRRLMRGITALRESRGADAVELSILSAGYGLVDGRRSIAPYEATFQGAKRGELRRRAENLGIPEDIRRTLARRRDLTLVLLGNDYLEACQLDEKVELGAPTIFFCSAASAKKTLGAITEALVVPLGKDEASRFHCALVGLKGELAGRTLERVADHAELVDYLGVVEPWELLDLLDDGDPKAPLGERKRRANPRAFVTLCLSNRWCRERDRRSLAYFIPEWDDLVDPDYDFLHDQHWGGTGAWSNQVYAHQALGEPAYDGILISRSVAEEGKKKKARINKLGVHRYLRVPADFPVMGDCGAFNYRDEERPPYVTSELVDFYTRLGVDYGVSIDHLIIRDDAEERRFRYDLTMDNAEAFLAEHRAQGAPWVPIGAVQGWDAESYAAAAGAYVEMGYRYLGLGGLVRTRTRQLLPILEAVRQVVPQEVAMHLFGIGRLDAIEHLQRLGLRSFDSSSYLRQAWMRTETSYVLPEASYAALRIPEASPAFCRRALKRSPDQDEAGLRRLETEALAAVRDYADGCRGLEEALAALIAYDRYVTADRVDLVDHYRRTLEARPWERCQCAICRDAGVEVIIFRGNNRNRRRGFHNTHVFYQLLAETLKRS